MKILKLLLILSLASCANDEDKAPDVGGKKDIEIKKDAPILKDQKVNRLVLAENAKLFTEGKDITIEAEEIISNGGIIETFPEGKTAAAGMAGRSGGRITIRAKRGTGILFINARGENGGEGLVGKQGGSGEKGPQGANGVCGWKNNDPFCLTVKKAALDHYREMAKVPGPEGEVAKATLALFYCKSETQDGFPGATGQPGGIGGNGYLGGDSASVSVVLDESSPLDVRISARPGQGGTGGKGGPGGEGGIGGDPGGQDHLGLCRTGTFGPKGPVGPTGPVGMQGVNGKAKSNCVKNGSSQIGDCEGH